MTSVDMPNTFITDDGQIIFCNTFELDKNDMDQIAVLENTVKHIENKYKTKDIKEMMLAGISRKILRLYLDAKHDLLICYGID